MNTPLSVYIHWPFCKSKCPYCDFNSHVRDRVEHSRWRDALLRDVAAYAPILTGRTVVSIFFGGGTPSLMEPETVGAIIDAVQRHWQVANDIEITLEANPTSVEAGKFREFREAGVNRVSLGVQALNDADLAFLGRHHSAKEALAAVHLAQELFPRSSFDLIYARPAQTVAAWEQELAAALKLAKGHLSLYQLTIEENTAFYHAYQHGDFALPQEDSAVQLYQLTHDMTRAAGLPGYEISNYAAPGQESRHNLAYWQGAEYIGIGPGAHGRYVCGLPDAHDAVAHWVASDAIKSPERWLENNERGSGHVTTTPLTARERLQEMVMMHMRLNSGINKSAWQQQTGVALMEVVSVAAVTTLTEHGFLAADDANLRTTMSGQLLLNSVIRELLS